jgi:predicted Fe-Mo cluster-binding NifX family protein
MKIAISATGRDLESNIDAFFGRALFFLIMDTTTKEVKVIENKARDRQEGVGITAVNTVEGEAINAVITANIGPLAFKTFKQSGVKIYKAKGKIRDAVRLFEDGKLNEITKATKSKYAGLNRN